MFKSIPFIVIIALLNLSKLWSQNPYYDAIELRKLNPVPAPSMKYIFKKNDSVIVVRILKKYVPGSLYYSSIQLGFANNPFIGVATLKNMASANPWSISNISSGFMNSSVGNLDVTNLADGFAKFLVKRTKEELNVAFFSKFSDLISKEEYKDARTLFPQTYNLLNAIGSQIYNYEAYINGLKESFEKDLNSLLPNLEKVIKDPKYQTFFSKSPELRAICLGTIYIGEGMLAKEQPGKIVADFPVDSIFSNNSLINAKAAMQTFQLLSESIKSKSSSNYWVGTDSLNILFSDPVARNIYFGLLYQQALSKNITFSNGAVNTTLSSVIANVGTNGTAIIQYIKSIQTQADIVSRAIQNLAGKEKDKVTFTDYYSLYNSVLDLLGKAIEVQNIPSLNFIKSDAVALKALTIARQGGDIALDISQKNYSSAIIGLFQLYVNCVEDQTQGKLKSFILKYGSFMAAISQASNSDDVEAAIEAVALPSGSSRIKRETPFNVSFNAYTGLYYGHEQIDGVIVKDKSYFNSYGVSAPVGLAISRGHSVFFVGTGKNGWQRNKYGWSSTLFLSVVDIGALAAFRFTNDSTKSVPNIQLKDIISPGVFYSIGIPKSPLSINCGYQLGPLLREVTQTKNSYSQNYTRFSISLCVDIPLLNCYTKSKD